MNGTIVNRKVNRRRQSGLSLVELMIAMTLGLFLIWGVTQSFLTSRQVYDMQAALSQIQENTRLAQEFIAFDIRNAGDYGCAAGDKFLTGAADIRLDLPNCGSGVSPNIVGTTGANMIQAITSVDDEYQYAVYGFDNATADLAIGGSAVGTLSPAPKAGTDVLMVHTATEIGSLNDAIPAVASGEKPPTLVANIANLTLAAGSTEALLATDRIAVSDCATTKVFGIGAAVNKGDTGITLGGNYCTAAAFAVGSSVRKVETIYYYVANKLDADGNVVGSSLYRAKGNNAVTGAAADELLEGVEDLQLEFGVDTNGDGNVDIYKNWSDAGHTPSDADWNGWDWTVVAPPDPLNPDHPEVNLVRAVRYHLLMSAGGDRLMADDQQHLMFYYQEYVGGVALPATVGRDRKLRQVVTSTIGIRSRVQ